MIKLRNMNENSARNYNMVEIGNLELYFSYETIVGFKAPKIGLVVSQNIWSSTTGKHLNWLDGGRKQCRTPHDEFEKNASRTTKRKGVGIDDNCRM